MREAVRAVFKTAVKAVTSRDPDAPQPEAKRRGKGEGGSPVIRQRRDSKPAARGRYAAMRAKTSKAGGRKLARAALGNIAGADLGLATTLDWIELWQNNAADHWLDEDFSAKQQDRYFPHP